MRNSTTSISGYSALQWRILLVMMAMNFINYVDRTVVFPLFHLIGPEFQVSDFELGLLGTAFILVHSLALLPLGVLADRVSRTRIVAFGALFWSAATVMTGLASSYRFLLGIRALVGIGESAYAPASASIITDVFPPEQRARVQSYYALGMFAGGTVGMILGGLLGAWVGWRAAFFVVGVPGLLLFLVAYRSPDPMLAAGSLRAVRYRMGDTLRRLLAMPAYVLILAGGALMTFATGCLITWGTEFAIRYYGFTLRSAAVTLALVVLSAGTLGVVGGGWTADALERRWLWGRALTVGVAILLAAPFLLLAIYAPNRAVLLVALFVASFFLTVYHGSVTAVIHDITPVSIHGVSFAAYVFSNQLLGNMSAPVLVGLISDRFELRTGLLLAELAVLAGGVVFLLVARSIRKGALRAAKPLPEDRLMVR